MSVSEIRIAIIGPSREVPKVKFAGMVKAAAALCDKLATDKKITLVSGGAAWCDHIAVMLANRFGCPLELHLPCPLDAKTKRFVDNGAKHWAANPGRLANACHDKFAKATGIASLAELAALNGAAITTHKGFHARNLAVGRVDALIAFARGEACSGGTKHTFDKSSCKNKYVVNLNICE